MKQKIILILVCLAIIIGIFIRNIQINQERLERESNNIEEDVMTDSISRAHVAKMLCFAAYTREECEALDRIISYEDTGTNKWYDKYINGVETLELMKEEENFRPNDALTYGEAKDILKKYELSDYGRLNFTMEDKSDKDPIPFTDWLSVYEYICTEVYNYVPEQKDIFVLTANEGKSDAKNWTVITEDEKYLCEGFSLEGYVNQTITVIVKDNEILAVKSVEEVTVTLDNIWIINGKGQNVTVFVNGVQRTFDTENDLETDISEVVGDLIISNGKVTKISVKPNMITGKVLAATSEYIELQGYGKIFLDENYKIYKIYGDLASEKTNAILVGYETTDFVITKDRISAALIKESIKAENIRVLLKTTGYKDVFHDTVVLTSNKDFTIYYGKKEKKYKAGKKITIKQTSKFLSNGRLRVETKENGKIELLSIERSYGNPSYRGSIEVSLEDQGLIVINELTLEEYLYAVVPSEMPTSYGVEALEVQAVCARSYAYNQLLANSYGEYGAHIDDSTSYQVYNNVEENENSIQAVKNTYGKVLSYKDKIISAYYFSTSCGYTSSADEVWMNNNPVEYLTGKLQVPTKETKDLDLTDEETFRDFIINKKYDTYDSEFAWYRWKTYLSLKDLKQAIDSNLSNRYNANNQLILTLVKGKYVSIPIQTVGDIENIKVTKRATGGIATELIIKGSENTVKVISEYNIRCLLSPSNSKVIRQDKSEIADMGLLPSAFIIIDDVKKDKELTGFQIRGGGYGHGVGMSQNGVKGMVDDKQKYEDILKYYYPGIDIAFIYE
jgi:stage II sporulation protein D